MNTKIKIFEIALALVILVGIASIPFTSSNQTASIGSFFGPDNTNETVLAAQVKLKEIDLYNGRLSGLFGRRTREAVFQFQALRGLTQNGILDIPTQTALFNLVAEPEYVSISYTNEGNTFLTEWVRYILGIEGKKVELKGVLSLAQEDALYGGVSTKLVLTSEDGIKYSVANISSRSLDGFLNQNVVINGLMVAEENSAGLFTVLVNYIETGEEDFPISIGYTKDGNQYIQKWVNGAYQEEHGLSGLVGVLSVGRKAQYAPGGNHTQLVLTASDGSKYSIENLSNNNLALLAGNDIMIRGMVLNNLNSIGFKTIVINYILNSEENPGPVALPALGN